VDVLSSSKSHTDDFSVKKVDERKVHSPPTSAFYKKK
jgi:hypothetical protein